MKTIKLKDIWGDNLTSRDLARNMRDRILSEDYNLVIIDFNGVSFASRSFMDEFYNEVLLNSRIDAEIINISNDIDSLLSAVSATQHKAHKIKRGDVKSFSSVREVNDYLNTLSFI